jgi:hypothetical protein
LDSWWALHWIYRLILVIWLFSQFYSSDP